MNSKTLLLLGAVGAVAMASAEAQVYSVNAVGYVNVSVPANTFKMIANQLKGTNSTIGSVLAAVPDGSSLFKWTGTSYASYDFIAGAGWLPDGAATLTPGEGVFIKSPTAFTVTFIGDVPTGALSTPLRAGFTMASSQVPQAGGIDVLGFPAADTDQVFQWGGTSYSSFDYIAGAGWLPSVPTVAVGEAFFVKKAVATAWTRTFSVN